jgi:FtsZ-binding cell division protein ZapB
MLMSQAQEVDTKTTGLVMELESLKTQKVTLEAEKATVVEERDQAQMQARALSSYAGMA